MGKLWVKFMVEVGKDRYFGYKETGEAIIEMELPVSMFDNFDAGSILYSLLPVALENFYKRGDSQDEE